MSYFDVYQKRLKKSGTTRQEVVQNHRRKEFDLVFMKRTIYKATIYKINDVAVAMEISLQPNKWNESNIIGNILVSKTLEILKTGDVVSIKMEIANEKLDKDWIILFDDEDITRGYHAYKAVALDTEINITDEYGTTKFSTPAKIINASQSIMQDTITRSLKELGYREPGCQRILIAPRHEELKKGVYFEYDGRGWEIIGQDALSIPRVTYVFIAERLLEEPEPLSSEEILVGEDTNFFLNGR